MLGSQKEPREEASEEDCGMWWCRRWRKAVVCCGEATETAGRFIIVFTAAVEAWHSSGELRLGCFFLGCFGTASVMQQVNRSWWLTLYTEED